MMPVPELPTLSVLAGILLISQGIASIPRACFSGRLWR